MGPGTARALLGAGGFAVATALVYVASYQFRPIADWDGRVLQAYLALQTPAVERRAAFFTEFLNTKPFAVAVLIVLVAAVATGGVRFAVAAAVIFAGGNVTTQALQLLTEAPRDHPYPWLPMTVWPSGHVCAGTTLAICVVLAAPTQLRPFLAGLGAIGVVGTSYAVVALGAHRPSDAIAGMLVAAAWACLAAAALRRRSGRARGVALAAAAGAAVTALGFAAIVVEVSPPSRLLEATVAGAVAMAVCGAFVVGASGLLPEPSRGRVS